MTEGKTTKITLNGARSADGAAATDVAGLGLTRIGKTVSVQDNPPTLGMIRKSPTWCEWS